MLAVGTRLQDFTTGSWTLFGSDTRVITVNTARADALKHGSLPVVGDARESLVELSGELDRWPAHDAWSQRARGFRDDRVVPDRDVDLLHSHIDIEGCSPLAA